MADFVVNDSDILGYEQDFDTAAWWAEYKCPLGQTKFPAMTQPIKGWTPLLSTAASGYSVPMLVEEVARRRDVFQGFLLCVLRQEQRLTERPLQSAQQNDSWALRWACGYGCYKGSSLLGDESTQGVHVQLDLCAAWFAGVIRGAAPGSWRQELHRKCLAQAVRRMTTETGETITTATEAALFTYTTLDKGVKDRIAWMHLHAPRSWRPAETLPSPNALLTWQAEAVAFVKQYGISDGERPNDPATRGEVFEQLRRVMLVLAQKQGSTSLQNPS
jgi:hypothetical protein